MTQSYAPRDKFFVTVDAVCIIPTSEGEKVLLIQRRNESKAFPGMWALPGGHLEHSEDAETAVLRELKEETGVSALLDTLVGVYSKPGRDPRGPYVTAAYLVTPSNLDVQHADDAIDAKWVPIKDALNMQLAFDHNVIIRDAHIAWMLMESMAQ